MVTSMTATDSVLKAVDTAREQVSESAGKISSVAMNEAAKVKSAVTTSAADVADSAMSAAREQASEWQNLLSKEINERPMRAIGVAMALGFLFGWTRR